MKLYKVHLVEAEKEVMLGPHDRTVGVFVQVADECPWAMFALCQCPKCIHRVGEA